MYVCVTSQKGTLFHSKRKTMTKLSDGSQEIVDFSRYECVWNKSGRDSRQWLLAMYQFIQLCYPNISEIGTERQRKWTSISANFIVAHGSLLLSKPVLRNIASDSCTPMIIECCFEDYILTIKKWQQFYAMLHIRRKMSFAIHPYSAMTSKIICAMSIQFRKQIG